MGNLFGRPRSTSVDTMSPDDQAGFASPLVTRRNSDAVPPSAQGSGITNNSVDSAPQQPGSIASPAPSASDQPSSLADTPAHMRNLGLLTPRRSEQDSRPAAAVSRRQDSSSADIGSPGMMGMLGAILLDPVDPDHPTASTTASDTHAAAQAITLATTGTLGTAENKREREEDRQRQDPPDTQSAAGSPPPLTRNERIRRLSQAAPTDFTPAQLDAIRQAVAQQLQQLGHFNTKSHWYIPALIASSLTALTVGPIAYTFAQNAEETADTAKNETAEVGTKVIDAQHDATQAQKAAENATALAQGAQSQTQSILPGFLHAAQNNQINPSSNADSSTSAQLIAMDSQGNPATLSIGKVATTDALNQVQNTANSAANTASSAQNDATNALTTANTAAGTATNALTTANSAVGNASNALASVVSAQFGTPQTPLTITAPANTPIPLGKIIPNGPVSILKAPPNSPVWLIIGFKSGIQPAPNSPLKPVSNSTMQFYMSTPFGKADSFGQLQGFLNTRTLGDFTCTSNSFITPIMVGVTAVDPSKTETPFNPIVDPTGQTITNGDFLTCVQQSNPRALMELQITRNEVSDGRQLDTTSSSSHSAPSTAILNQMLTTTISACLSTLAIEAYRRNTLEKGKSESTQPPRSTALIQAGTTLLSQAILMSLTSSSDPAEMMMQILTNTGIQWVAMESGLGLVLALIPLALNPSTETATTLLLQFAVGIAGTMAGEKVAKASINLMETVYSTMKSSVNPIPASTESLDRGGPDLEQGLSTIAKPVTTETRDTSTSTTWYQWAKDLAAGAAHRATDLCNHYLPG